MLRSPSICRHAHFGDRSEIRFPAPGSHPAGGLLKAVFLMHIKPFACRLCLNQDWPVGRLRLFQKKNQCAGQSEINGVVVMNRKISSIIFAILMMGGAGTALACEYKAGETKFLDYANCRYGEDSIVVVDLPDGSGWEHCVYYLQAFRPSKLLAVTKMENGKEIHSVNDRTQIGNPCYLSKRKCDVALKAYKQREGIF
jgi:hypothetical protein